MKITRELRESMVANVVTMLEMSHDETALEPRVRRAVNLILEELQVEVAMSSVPIQSPDGFLCPLCRYSRLYKTEVGVQRHIKQTHGVCDQ